MSGKKPEKETTTNPQKTRILSSLTAALLAAACLVNGGCAGKANVRTLQRGPIAVESVHLSAAGRFVDLRYRVLDPERAQAALGPKVRPRLIDESTGAVMGVPTTAKLGSLRQTQGEQKTGRTYFVLFVNSGVREGSLVTAELGDLRIEHLRIE